MKKIAYISIHPAPYRDAFLSRIVRTNSFSVDVYSVYSTDEGHKFWDLSDAEYDYVVLAPNGNCGLRVFVRLLRLFVFSRRYDVVIWPGYVNWCIRACIFLSAILGKRYGFVADTAVQRKLCWMARIVKGYFVRRASIISVVGCAGRRVFEKEYGINPNKIVEGAYSLDGLAIEARILSIRNTTREEIRNSLGIDNDATVFLMVANMIKTRHYPITSAGFIDFARNNPNCYFVMVGKGPELEAMEKLAESNSCLRVIPGCSFDRMLSLYAAADVYVHGGTEPASTALVIGAIAHLPLISSQAVGCYHDVVKDGASGFSVEDYLAPTDWRAAFSAANKAKEKWAEMGCQARALSRKLDVDVVAPDFIAHISRVVEVR